MTIELNPHLFSAVVEASMLITSHESNQQSGDVLQCRKLEHPARRSAASHFIPAIRRTLRRHSA